MSATKPTDFTLRPPTLDDLPAIVELINRCSMATIGEASLSVEQLRGHWEEPDFAYSKQVCLAIEGAQIVGYCAISLAGTSGNYDLMINTHRTADRDVGMRLMQWAETYVIGKPPLAPPNRQVKIHSNNYRTDGVGRQLLLDRGYKRIRSFYEMKIEMISAPLAPVWPVGILVRTMLTGQEKAIFRANEEAFHNEPSNSAKEDSANEFAARFARWQQWLQTIPDYTPAFFFVAWDGDEIAGVALAFPKDPEFSDMGWLQSLSVRQPWRRRGLGLALLHHLFGVYYSRGIYKVVLTVDSAELTGATRLYERAGMHTFLQWDRYEKELGLTEN